MVVIVFRSRVAADVDEAALEAMGARMYSLASAMPGFVSYREYAAADGEGVAIVEFESHETLAAWREHPEHRHAQAAGRDHIFSEYRITVCDAVRDYAFNARDASAHQLPSIELAGGREARDAAPVGGGVASAVVARDVRASPLPDQ